jgi:hypothetical protein
MMNHIDLSSVLRQTLECDLYSSLVTRGTGAAVRVQIEVLLSETLDRALTVIDFSQVSIIDISCADEIVAKLLLRYADDTRPQDAYFLFRGVTDFHRDAIETVLKHHGLALVLEQNDGMVVFGVLSDDERRAWDATYRLGRADAAEIAGAIGGDTGETERTLDGLCRRRLVMRVDGGDAFMAVGSSRG